MLEPPRCGCSVAVAVRAASPAGSGPLLALGALLLGCASAPARPAPIPEVTVLELPRPAGAEWFAIHVSGKRLGYSSSWVGVENRNGERVLVARHSTTISADVGGRVAREARTDEKVYEARPGGRLLAFTSQRRTDGEELTVDGRCTPASCDATITTRGRREQRLVPGVDETVEQADAARLAALRRTTVTGRQLDLETLSMVTMEDHFAGAERSLVGGAEREVALVEERARGGRVPTQLRVGTDGSVLEVRMGQIVASAESEEAARQFSHVNLAALARVPLPGALPRTVPGSVTFKLRGVPRELQLSDGRQTWAPQPDGTAFVTVTASHPEARDPARDAPRAEAAAKRKDPMLSPTFDVDSNAPAIQQLVRDVVGATPGTFAASSKIAHHVALRIEEANVPPSNRASEVLALHRGGCKERALLFTALARAAGVPARRVHGLAFFRHADGVPALYWTEWVEVRSGREWIAMDPTLDQLVADATHIAFGRDKDTYSVGLIGAVEVLGVEAR